MAKWKPNTDPQTILDRLNRAKPSGAVTIRTSNSSASFDGFVFHEALAILEDSIEFQTDASAAIRYRFCHDAAFAVGERAKMTADSFLAHVTQLELEYRSRPAKRYYLVTSINLDPNAVDYARTRIGNTTISFARSLPKKWRENRIELASFAKWSFYGDAPDNYLNVKVGTLERSIEDAAQRSLDSLNVLRGIWNLGLNRSISTRIPSSGGRQVPVNSVMLGPLHTVHLESGELATEMWWYDPNYRGPLRLMTDQAKIERMLKYSTSFRQLLRGNHYVEYVTRALQRYVYSLDHFDQEDAFVQLWSTLEYLTGTLRDPSKTLVKRASFIFEDYDYSREVLSRLAELRNEIVHAGKDSAQIETKLFMVKMFVEALIEFHVRRRFESPNLAFEFLDQPPQPDVLKRKLQEYRAALSFRIPSPET